MAKSKPEVTTEVYAFEKERISLDYAVWLGDSAIAGGSIDLTRTEAKELRRQLKVAIERHDENLKESK